MISVGDIRELEQFKSESPNIISLYLALGPGSDHIRRLDALIQEAAAKDPALAQYREDLEQIRRFVSEFDAIGRQSLAVFCARARGLWKALPLPQWVKSQLRREASPYLPPLHNVLDQHQRFGVVLLDSQRARFLEVYLGQIEEHPLGPPLAAARSREPLSRHFKSLAAQLAAFSRRLGLDRLILGAPTELESRFIHYLNGRLQDNLIVDARMHLGMGVAEALEKVATGEKESRKVRESVLVYRLLDASKSDKMGVVGLEETLLALNRGQVRMLLIREGLARMGRVCRHCGALSLAGKKCAYCWLDTEHVINLIDEMAQLALEGGAEVFHLRQTSRLDAFGGVGAELCSKLDAQAPREEKRREGSALTGAPTSSDA